MNSRAEGYADSHAPGPPYPQISVQPQVMSGRPCIAGTRVRVMDIIGAKQAGVPDDELLEHSLTRTLTRSELRAALAYYNAHQGEIDAAPAEDAELGGQAERKQGQPSR